jgi:hypothetical protein
MSKRQHDSQSPAPEPHRPRPATRRDVVGSVLLTAVVPAVIWAFSYPFVAAAVAAATLAAVAVAVHVDGPSAPRRVTAAVGRLGRP